MFDIDLNRENWESTMFQFFAGDLYEVFPLLQSKYYASEKVNGNCRANYNNLKVVKSTHETFNVTIQFDCELNIVNKEKFGDFQLGLELEIGGRPGSQNWYFNLVKHSQHASFYPYGGYKI